jgi:hypothetical protein
MADWFILWKIGLFYGRLVYFMEDWFIWMYYLFIFTAIWYIFSCFGMLYQEKSGNPASEMLTDRVRHRVV